MKKLELEFEKQFDEFWKGFSSQLIANKYDGKRIESVRMDYRLFLDNSIFTDMVSDFNEYISELFLDKPDVLFITQIKRSIWFNSFKTKGRRIKQPLSDKNLRELLEWIAKVYNEEMIRLIILSKFYLIEGIIDINKLQTGKRMNQIGNRKLNESSPAKMIYDEIIVMNSKGVSVYKCCQKMSLTHAKELSGNDRNEKFMKLYKNVLAYGKRNHIKWLKIK